MTDNWRDRAACLGADPRLFDPLDGSETNKLGTAAEAHPRIQEAIAVCRRCPVRADCGRHAGKEEGVWAGSYRSKMKAERAAGKKVAA